jgi:hypothetical protein
VVAGEAAEVDSLGTMTPLINTRSPGRNPEKSRAKIPVMINPTLCWLGLPRHINHRIENIRAKIVKVAMRAMYPYIQVISTSSGGDPGGSAEGGSDGRIGIIIANIAVSAASTKKKMSWITAAIITSVEDVPSSAIRENLL